MGKITSKTYHLENNFLSKPLGFSFSGSSNCGTSSEASITFCAFLFLSKDSKAVEVCPSEPIP